MSFAGVTMRMKLRPLSKTAELEFGDLGDLDAEPRGRTRSELGAGTANVL